MTSQANKIGSLFEQLQIDLDSIQDQKLRETIYALFNLIENQAATIRSQQEEIQRLSDENNRLKGEQGKPRINAKKKSETKASDISSEKERKEGNRQVKRSSINDKVKIARSHICEVDKNQLPDDAKFKGYETVIIQDLKIETDNVEFRKEVYYSPSEHKTYRGDLPAGYEGGFGPTVKAFTIIMKNICNVSEPRILDLLHNFNIHISLGSISNILIKKKEIFHKEKHDLVESGLESSVYQQIDDTGARLCGQNYHTHVLCNNLYSAYFTTEKKKRLTILELLQNGSELRYSLNQEGVSLAIQLGVGQKYIKVLKEVQSDQEYSKQEITKLLNNYFPSLKERVFTKILEATAIAWYHKGVEHPVVKVFLCDDAPQFKIITEELALCWVHDGRFYKKLHPVIPHHANELKEFLTDYWEYYRKVLSYKRDPCNDLAFELSEEFDELFSRQFSYQALNERILKSKQKKQHLLLVLKYPELPLHNNASELAARAQVRKRDVSLHTMTNEGTNANDTFLTITQTCKKLGVNAYEYIFDRVTKNFNLPSLAQIIREKTLSS